MQNNSINTGLNRKLKIAVTGGIGSGKSLVCRYFESAGYLIINADSIAKNIMQNDPGVIDKIKKAFGNDVYSGNQLNKEFISKRIFSNKADLKKINSIVHPVTIQKINEIADNELLLKNIVFVESALIFEAKREKYFDYILLVSAPLNMRINRIIARDNLRKSEIVSRMENQLDDDEKKKKAHFVINNDSDIDDLNNKAKLFLGVFENLSNISDK